MSGCFGELARGSGTLYLHLRQGLSCRKEPCVLQATVPVSFPPILVLPHKVEPDSLITIMGISINGPYRDTMKRIFVIFQSLCQRCSTSRSKKISQSYT